MRYAWPMLVLCALGCERPTGIALRVTGLKKVPTSRALLVTYQLEGAKQPPQTFPLEGLTLEDDKDTARLGLLLPREVRGDVKVTVQALPPRDQDAFILGQGDQSGAPTDRRLELEVPLQPQQLCSQSGWCWELPLPSARQMRALWGSGPNDVWAAGDFGTLLHYDGQYWSVEKLPAEAGEPDLYALWGSGRDDVWAVGGYAPLDSTSDMMPHGVVLHRDGSGWQAIRKPGWRFVAGLAGVQRGEVWVGGQVQVADNQFDGFLARCRASAGTAGTCENETRMRDLLPDRKDVIPTGLWRSGQDGSLFAVATGTDNGNTRKGIVLRYGPADQWKRTSEQGFDVRRVFGANGFLWVGARKSDRYPLSNSSDQTYAYALPDDTMPDTASDLLPLLDDGARLWGIQSGGRLASQPRMPRASSLPVPEALPAPPVPMDYARLPVTKYAIGDQRVAASLAALWRPQDVSGDLWAAGTEGFVSHRSGDWGARGKLPLAAAPSIADVPLVYGLWARSTSEVYAVVEGGRILRSSGRAWSEEKSPTSGRLLAVWGLPQGDVFAVGLGGTILRRQGDAWTAQAVPQAAMQSDLFSIWGSAPGDLFAAGSGGLILRWDGDAGGGWKIERAGGDGATLFSLWGAGDSDRWAVGCTGYPNSSAPIALRRSGSTWVAAEIKDPPKACFSQVWLGQTGPVSASATAMSGSSATLYQFDRTSGVMLGSPRSTPDRCVGLPELDRLLCSTDALGGGARYLNISDAGSGTGFEFGAEAGRWPGRFFVLGRDIWAYGVGILHCQKGSGCLDPRR